MYYFTGTWTLLSSHFQWSEYLPRNAGLGFLPLLTRSLTVWPPFLMSSMASPWVMFLVVWPLISISWSPTWRRPSWVAGPGNKNIRKYYSEGIFVLLPSTAILSTNKGIEWNSLPPLILKPNPFIPLCNSTAKYWSSSDRWRFTSWSSCNMKMFRLINRYLRHDMQVNID